MSTQTPTIALVHGAFAESASWGPVIERLHQHGTALVAGHHRDAVEVVAIANPLRPAELVRFMAERAGSRRSRELAGGSHAISVSRPDDVAATILEAVTATILEPAATR